jgi:very-short-patch-repair endonuclease
MPVKLTLEDFIEKSRKVHGNRYDYSHVLYHNTKTKVKIICKKHGEFYQLPTNHLIGNACFECFKEKISSTTEEFIKKARLTHGDRYDYLGTVYKNNKSKVKITCKKHGGFYVAPNNHLNGVGCKSCMKEKLSELKTYDTLEEFVEKAKKVHGDAYNYFYTKYINTRTPVEILCPYHGFFYQIPSNHLRGATCKKCSITRQKRLITKSMRYFIDRAKKVHGDKYEYNLINYVDLKTKVKIICKKHGGFQQTPSNHINGNGCPTCNESKGELRIRNFLIQNSIIFKRGEKFPNCRYKKRLSFDFYLPELNIMIEFDGRQHFGPVSFGSLRGQSIKEKYKLTQIRDKIKNDFCQKSGIKLIRIPYFKFDKIETTLNKELGVNRNSSCSCPP